MLHGTKNDPEYGHQYLPNRGHAEDCTGKLLQISGILVYNENVWFLLGSHQEKGKKQHSQARKPLAALLKKGFSCKIGV